MITLYASGSPNPHKVSIALEELGLDYKTEIVNVHEGAQFADSFKALNPNAKVPVIIDHDTDQTVYESNAILIYLADKAGELLPPSGVERDEAIQLLFLQAASVGPMFGQRAHFSLFAPEKPQYAVDRYVKEAERLEALLDTLLEDREYFLKSGYSIVDIAFYGWVNTAVAMGFGIVDHQNLSDWYERVGARPAVAKGVAIPLPLPNFQG